jgi:sulfur-oxidizing protein SoxX
MQTNSILRAAALGTAVLAGCASMGDEEAAQKAVALMKASFVEQGQAKLDRLDQDETQRLCSKPPAAELARTVAERIEKVNLEAIRYPADGRLLGDWKSGERIAQSGVGMQYSDDPKQPSGANCYACHQLSKQEISFGTIGPSLYQYGKLRGAGEAIQRYTYGKIYNSQAFTACSNMPRFGHQRILTEQQMKDLTALLLDPESPVNK